MITLKKTTSHLLTNPKTMKYGLNKTMNHLKMLQDINALINTDFSFGMELKKMPGSREYTQQEAKMMSEIISKVYTISHGIHCEACGKKYK